MIRVERLSKSFRGRQAIYDVSLEISTGAITGLLGPNGAGKSTLIGMILGQVRPDAGEVLIDGKSVQRERARALQAVGAIFEAPGFYEQFSGWENIACLASLSGKVDPAQVARAVEFTGLRDRIHEKVRGYSRGMRLRLALAQSLVPMPRAVILDEPMEGLDPEGIHDARELIRRLRNETGLTVLLSSHLLGEIGALCDRVAILKEGKIVFDGACEPVELERTYLRVAGSS